MINLAKRFADWLEKMSVAALAVGLFQGKWSAILLGVGTFSACMIISGLLGRGSK